MCIRDRHKITAKTATTITFEPDLPIDYDSSPEYAQYGTADPIENAGVEGIKFDLDSNTQDAAVLFEIAWNCWMYDCEVTNHDRRLVRIQWSGKIEIRKNYFYDQDDGGPNSEGIELFADASWNKVVDNILVAAGFPQISLAGFGTTDHYSGSIGNVIALSLIHI